MPINIDEVRNEVIRENEKLKESVLSKDPMRSDTQRILEALIAIYERQGDQILLNLTTGGR